ncbi:hypothetical protein PpBr36_02522 [Pyricularia pennisetigena]|uniref:hypothetical protein n=1 Tax=Pyricularia pennisetigena TaxID=1578925 RepID=UPI00114E5613|nr:hypothetical protein PpBr36_02522 [Pyricularia pennisetigena]TLS30594.1 hypothetical protein PpBr36_02522 [Pyricularia pennisetigena]
MSGATIRDDYDNWFFATNKTDNKCPSFNAKCIPPKACARDPNTGQWVDPVLRIGVEQLVLFVWIKCTERPGQSGICWSTLQNTLKQISVAELDAAFSSLSSAQPASSTLQFTPSTMIAATATSDGGPASVTDAPGSPSSSSSPASEAAGNGNSSGGLSAGAIAGMVVGLVLGLAVIAASGFLIWQCVKRRDARARGGGDMHATMGELDGTSSSSPQLLKSAAQSTDRPYGHHQIAGAQGGAAEVIASAGVGQTAELQHGKGFYAPSELDASSNGAAAAARDIPENIKKLRESIIARGDCKKKLASGFRTVSEDKKTGSYCGDLLDSAGVIYQQMPGGQLSDMDIDCDGQQTGRQKDDGRCSKSKDTQAETSFADILKSYNVSIKDLNPFVHSYVVFGNEGKPGWPQFRPNRVKTKNGKKVEPLSVMAVVCGDKMFYGVWGDENGPDGDHPMMGEVGIGLATACYGSSEIDGDNGHSENDVLYLAFTGEEAVPGARGARWDASSFEEFESSLHPIGDSLIKRIDGSIPGKSGHNTTSIQHRFPAEEIRRGRPRRILRCENPEKPAGSTDADPQTTGDKPRYIEHQAPVPAAADEGAVGPTVEHAKEEESRDSLKMETSGGVKDNGDMGEKPKDPPKDDKPKDPPKDDKPKDPPKDDKPKDPPKAEPQKPRPDGSMDSLKMETGPGIKDNGDMGEKKPDDKKPDDKKPDDKKPDDKKPDDKKPDDKKPDDKKPNDKDKPKLSPQGFEIIDPMAKDYNRWDKGLEGDGKPDDKKPDDKKPEDKGKPKMSPQGFEIIDPLAKNYNRWEKGFEGDGKPDAKPEAKPEAKPDAKPEQKPATPKDDKKEAEKKEAEKKAAEAAAKKEADKKEPEKKNIELRQSKLPIAKRPEVEGFMK